jgi:hypothetical protein
METATMGRPKGSKRVPERRSIKIDASVLTRAELVAKDRGQSLAEYISDILRGPVDREFTKLVMRLKDQTSSD